MSHSFRHTPIFGTTCCKSSKWYKQQIHREERARFHAELARAKKTGDYDNLDVEFSPYNSWSDPRDGKSWQWDWYPSGGYGIHYDNFWSRRSSGYFVDSEHDRAQADAQYKKAFRK